MDEGNGVALIWHDQEKGKTVHIQINCALVKCYGTNDYTATCITVQNILAATAHSSALVGVDDTDLCSLTILFTCLTAGFGWYRLVFIDNYISLPHSRIWRE